MKLCNDCNIEKDDSCFNKKSAICKPCQKIYNKQYRLNNAIEIKQKEKIAYQNNKEEKLAAHKEWYQENKIEQREKKKVYYAENKETIDARVKEYDIKNKQDILDYHKQYYIENKEDAKEYQVKYRIDNAELITQKRREYDAIRRATDPLYKLRKQISRAVNIFLKKSGTSKNGKSLLKYIDYTMLDLKEHLQSLFEPWMTWDNHGIYKKNDWIDSDQLTWKWQIDHIIPHSMFEYTSMEDQAFRDCWALSNLRPYSAKQNVLDGNRRGTF